MRRFIALIATVLVLSSFARIDTVGHDTPPAQPDVSAPGDEEEFPPYAVLAYPPDVEPQVTAVGTFGQVIGLQPGDAVTLVLGEWDYEQCGIGVNCFIPVSVDAAWSVSPGDGARIDAESGLLTIDNDTLGGVEFSVRAKVEGESQAVTGEVYVYTPESNPFVGYWQEVSQLSCDDGTEVSPEVAIQELVFAADGSFAVTWMPFESYVDYWGEYAYDLDSGTLELTVMGSNQTPDDVDGRGSFVIDANGDLVLTDLWLGTPSLSEAVTPNCGHRFAG